MDPPDAAFNATAPTSTDHQSAQALTAAAATAQQTGADNAGQAADPQLPQQVAALPSTTARTDRLTASDPEQSQPENAAEKADGEKPAQASTDSDSNVVEPGAPSEAPIEKPKSFLSAFFAGSKSSKPVAATEKPAGKAAETLAANTPAPTQFLENPAPKQVLENPAPAPEKNSRQIQLASLELPSQKPLRASAIAFADDGEGTGLPGVRQSALFEIKRKSGIDDDSDVDVHEDVDGGIEVASAAGMARLAPNGLLKQRENVDVACLKPSLVRVLKTVERRFGKRAIITSGYRSPSYNRSVRGARNSQHMYCAAADVIIPGVSKFELASFARSMQGRGGVGTYCHTDSVHVDVGPERDWNWRCRRRK